MTARRHDVTKEEIEQAAKIINRLPKGFLPYPLFMAVAAKVVTPTLELIILRKSHEGLEVLMTKRLEEDVYWPGEWHIPGTVIRSTDAAGTFASCFERILQDELKGLVSVTEPEFVSIEFWDIHRGREIDQLYIANVKASAQLSDGMAFFPIDNLPSNTMEHHVSIVEIAKSYLGKKAS